jgi:hypothetical protein
MLCLSFEGSKDDEALTIQRNKVVLSILSAGCLLFGIIYFSTMLYVDRHQSSITIAGDCISLALAVLFFTWYWRTTPDDDDPIKYFDYVSELGFKVALIISIFFFHVHNKAKKCPLWALIILSVETFLFYFVIYLSHGAHVVSHGTTLN